MVTTPLSDPHVEQAIAWMVAIRSGEMSEQEFRAFKAWHTKDARNAAAWARFSEVLEPFGVAARYNLPKGAVARRILKMRQDRRAVVASLAGLFVVGATAGLVNRVVPLGDFLAEQVTWTAERKRITLADGSTLVMAPRTAINVDFRPDARRVKLLQGQLMTTAVARTDRPSFVVTSDAFDVVAEEGSFVVDLTDGNSSVIGIKGRVILTKGGRDYDVGVGDHLIVDGMQIRRLKADIVAATSWVDGLLIAKDRSVSFIVDAIRPYFSGFVHVDTAVASRRATGVFDLQDPIAALQSLTASLDLSMDQIAHYWVSIGPTTRSI